MSSFNLSRHRLIPPQMPSADRLSCINISLPFALDNYTGPHYYRDGTCISFYVEHKAREVAEYDINFARQHPVPVKIIPPEKTVRLYPDNHGVTTCTNVFVYLTTFIPTGVTDALDIDEVVTVALTYVNPLLDFYTLATCNFGIGAIARKDIGAFHLFTYLPSDPVGSRILSGMNFVDFDVGESREPDTAAMGEIVTKVQYFNNLDESYKFAFRMYSQAMRAFAADDLRLAAIQAMVCLEGSVLHYIKARMREKKDNFNKIRVSVRAYEESKKDVPFSFMLRSIFPLLVPDDVAFPKDDADACNRLRKKRNEAVHDPTAFNAQGLKEELQAVESLLRFLIANHPKEVTGNPAPMQKGGVT
jgi:hypothetical protein